MNEQFNISASPHIRAKDSTGNIMLWVVIALLPATLFGIWNFRDQNAWILVIVTVAAAVLTEFVYEKLMHKKVTIQDMSAAVTGFCWRSIFRLLPHGGWAFWEQCSQF